MAFAFQPAYSIACFNLEQEHETPNETLYGALHHSFDCGDIVHSIGLIATTPSHRVAMLLDAHSGNVARVSTARWHPS